MPRVESARLPAALATQRPRQLVALIPAHNEGQRIGDALRALDAQTRRPDRVIVVCDNCTDNTAEVAREHAAEVLSTTGNTAKKAGALNQALRQVLAKLDGADIVLVQDADSALDPRFVATATKYLQRGYGAVGGVFRGSPGGGFVGHLQRNEYARYARDVRRLNGKCLVVTGTAAMFQVATLRQVSGERLAGTLPIGDGRGGVYDTSVLTEDNELTFALLHMGHKVISPAACTLATDVMPTWRQLWRQRLRWKRGAVENCAQYGLTRITWRYWIRQLVTFVGVLVSVGYLTTIALIPLMPDVELNFFWLWLTLIFVAERVITVRSRGWRRMLIAASMYELVFDYFLQACHAKAYYDALFRTARNW